MSGKSKIEWTNRTWNPLVGCTKVSRGCKHCYAMVMASRIANAAQAALRSGKELTDIQEAYRKVVKWKRGGNDPADGNDIALPAWNNRMELIDSLLGEPFRWQKPSMVFVNSMSDLFHPAVPDDFIFTMFSRVMAHSTRHTFQILTKRADRAAALLSKYWWRDMGRSPAAGGNVYLPIFADGHRETDLPFLPNVWIGTSIESRDVLKERADDLARCPAAVRFWSCEPLVGDIGDISPWLCSEGLGCTKSPWLKTHNCQDMHVDWVICGGESGHEAEPMHPDWARSLRDQCTAAGVPFFFKQWGEWLPGEQYTDACHERDTDETQSRFKCMAWNGESYEPNGGGWQDEPGDDAVYRVGKKLAGRVLDGRTWDEYPAGMVFAEAKRAQEVEI